VTRKELLVPLPREPNVAKILELFKKESPTRVAARSALENLTRKELLVPLPRDPNFANILELFKKESPTRVAAAVRRATSRRMSETSPLRQSRCLIFPPHTASTTVQQSWLLRPPKPGMAWSLNYCYPMFEDSGSVTQQRFTASTEMVATADQDSARHRDFRKADRDVSPVNSCHGDGFHRSPSLKRAMWVD
jgi:hypothetical protein